METRRKSNVTNFTDARGRKVEIKTLFSGYYSDEELEKLGVVYDVRRCNGKQRLRSLGKAELEVVAALLLALGKVTDCDCFVGVKKSELAQAGGHINYIDELLRGEYLRERMIGDDLVVFPTEKLLKNQRFPKKRKR